MGSFSIWHWLIILLVVVLIVRVPKRRDRDGRPVGLAGEPIFSSVHKDGDEVEHTDERLDEKPWDFKKWFVLFAALFAAAWVLTR
jgi:Sec-independent protein translocase protein TatA